MKSRLAVMKLHQRQQILCWTYLSGAQAARSTQNPLPRPPRRPRPLPHPHPPAESNCGGHFAGLPVCPLQRVSVEQDTRLHGQR